MMRARIAGGPPSFRLLVEAPWPFSDREYAIAPSLEDAFIDLMQRSHDPANA